MKFKLHYFAIVPALTSSLVFGYADVHYSKSPLPFIDIYKYKASSPEDAMNKHKRFARSVGLPGQVIDILDKIKGISAPAAAALAAPTGGISVALQEGVSIATDVLREINNLLGKTIKDLIAKAWRGGDHAFHEDVPRGNAGRFAEWKTDNVMYAIVTYPGSLIPLHAKAHKEDPHSVTGINIVEIGPDPKDPSKKLFEARFDGGRSQLTQDPNTGAMLMRAPSGVFAREYLPVYQDFRNKNSIRALATSSGEAALRGR